jgi:hypothetical protein
MSVRYLRRDDFLFDFFVVFRFVERFAIFFFM